MSERPCFQAAETTPSKKNLAPVVGVFEELDPRALNFSGVVLAVTGRPTNHPAMMLKLFISGYPNWLQSSLRLEREASATSN